MIFVVDVISKEIAQQQTKARISKRLDTSHRYRSTGSVRRRVKGHIIWRLQCCAKSSQTGTRTSTVQCPQDLRSNLTVINTAFQCSQIRHSTSISSADFDLIGSVRRLRVNHFGGRCPGRRFTCCRPNTCPVYLQRNPEFVCCSFKPQLSRKNGVYQ